jgi:hypothetical protein
VDSPLLPLLGDNKFLGLGEEKVARGESRRPGIEAELDIEFVVE